MNDKIKITQIVYDLCKDELEGNIDRFYFEWWVTGRTGSNLRLTDQGKEVFELADLEFFDFSLSTDAKNFPKILLELGKKIKVPFYVGVKGHPRSIYIRLYDSKLAMLITLYGDILTYIKK